MKFEFRETLPWTYLVLLIFPFFGPSNILVVEAFCVLFVFSLFIFNYKLVIITDDNIYIEKYKWIFRKKKTYSYSEISQVKLHYTKAFPAKTGIIFYFTLHPKKREFIGVFDSDLKELYQYFRKKNVKIISDTPSYLR